MTGWQLSGAELETNKSVLYPMAILSFLFNFCRIGLSTQ